MRNQNHYERILTIAITAAAVLMSGCTDADREMAARKGDGTETFKFQKPNFNEKADANTATKKKPSKEDSDGTDSFVFKRDPEINPKPK
jgi:hypothetical protein